MFLMVNEASDVRAPLTQTPGAQSELCTAFKLFLGGTSLACLIGKGSTLAPGSHSLGERRDPSQQKNKYTAYRYQIITLYGRFSGRSQVPQRDRAAARSAARSRTHTHTHTRAHTHTCLYAWSQVLKLYERFSGHAIPEYDHAAAQYQLACILRDQGRLPETERVLQVCAGSQRTAPTHTALVTRVRGRVWEVVACVC